MGSFPAGLPRYFIEQFSEPGDVVVDPFSGRGTTALEACLAGRVGIGVDLNPLAALLTDVKVDGLKDVLSGHPGQSPVLLHVGAKVLRLPPEFNVDCRNGLVGELKRLLGQSAVLS